jgi:hypothetical protein
MTQAEFGNFAPSRFRLPACQNKTNSSPHFSSFFLLPPDKISSPFFLLIDNRQ